MKVAVGSKNPIKIAAVKRAFEKVFPKESWSVEGISVSSGIPNQPTNDTETIQGATNRAQKALELSGADFGVGLEGGMQEINGKWFEAGWVVITNKAGLEGIGSSIRMHVPQKILELVEKGYELGDAEDIIFQKENTKQSEGFFGLMTNGHLDRTKAYADGVIAALAGFLQKDLY